MEVIFWWLTPIWLLVIIGFFVYYRRYTKGQHKQAKEQRTAVANSSRLTNLPVYMSALKSYHKMVFIITLLVSIALVSGVFLSMRPANRSIVEPELKNRDIMLCLDISSSMREANTEIMKTFIKLSKSFDGERIGLTVFNASPSPIFPLTNDYPFIEERLTELSGYLESGEFNYELYGGTSSSSNGSSLIGDGLAGCVMRFDTTNKERSRSIILATDNELAGNPIVTLAQAGKIAKKKNIRVYGINPDVFVSFDGEVNEISEEYKRVVLDTGGGYYNLEDPKASNDIVDQITKQDATRFKGAPQVIYSDKPLPLIVSSFIAIVGIIVLSWRLRL